MNDYYYNQAIPQNNAQPVSRPTGNSLEERSRQQREEVTLELDVLNVR